MTDYNLEIYRGDNKTWILTFVDGITPVNLTGQTIFFTVKKQNIYVESSSDTTDALISKTITAHTNPTGGISSLALVPADTSSLTPATYKYDMQLKDGSGSILTFITGNFTILADVTRRTV